MVPLAEIDRAAFDRVIAVNLTGSFLCAKAAAEHMRAAGWGRIVNTSSVTFDVGDPRFVHYVASKGGVVGLTRALCRELGPAGITVNTVSPGAIATERQRELWPDRDALARELFRLQAVQRHGTPEDIAAAVAFLVSDDASFITGQTLGVDGGWAMR
jgi:NAD(P)-dependent dehydrogenase (short-subunit alcohol dehydrogenase family)